MIWNNDISFEGFSNKINKWYSDKEFELCDPPIDAQYALDLIFNINWWQRTLSISHYCAWVNRADQ